MAIVIRQVRRKVLDLAKRAAVRIPDAEKGMQHLYDEYLASRLKSFHDDFYSVDHEPPEKWPETYDSAPLDALPPCARHILQDPNELLLKPAGMQLVTRSLLALGRHPRHIAGLIRSKFENPRFGWGDKWKHYDPGMRADFYTRIFAGLVLTGEDELVDFNCVSCQEKGFCFNAGSGCNLEPFKKAVLQKVSS